MSLDQDIDIVASQEQLLRFHAFSADNAWDLGVRLRQHSISLGAAMSVEIQVAGRTLFSCSTLDAPAGQADWIRRKRNAVLRFGKSSYALGLDLERDGRSIEQRHGLSLTDYALHGGAFPIVLHGTGLVGTVIASGLPQRDDHNMVIAALSSLTGIAVPSLP